MGGGVKNFHPAAGLKTCLFAVAEKSKTAVRLLQYSILWFLRAGRHQHEQDRGTLVSTP